MKDNKLFTWKYVKQARTRASKISVFVLLHGPSPASPTGSNQEPALLHCYFAVTTHHAVEHCRVGKKGVRNFFSSLSLSFSPPKILSLVHQIYLTEGPLGLHMLLLSAVPSQAVDTAAGEKLFFQTLYYYFRILIKDLWCSNKYLGDFSCSSKCITKWLRHS